MFNRMTATVAVAMLALQMADFCHGDLHPVVAYAHETGVSPESLVVAGIATSQCGTAAAVLNRIDQAASLRAAVDSARIAVDTAGQQITALATQLQVHSTDATLLTEYQQAVANLASARSAYAAAQEALRDEALDGIGSSQITGLATWRNAATRNVPAEFRVLDLTDSQWSAVERALRAERRANRLGEPLDTVHAQLLADLRSNMDVVDAAYQLAANLDAVELVFNQFTGE